MSYMYSCLWWSIASSDAFVFVVIVPVLDSAAAGYVIVFVVVERGLPACDIIAAWDVLVFTIVE